MILSKLNNWLYDHNAPRWLYEPIANLNVYFANWKDKTHYYPTGVRRGRWSDTTYRLQYAMEYAFCDYLESEFVQHKFGWCKDRDPGGDIYNRVMVALDIEEECLGWQAVAAKKARETYKYIKKDRPRLARIESGYLDMGYPDDLLDNFKRETTEKELHYRKRSWKYQDLIQELDQKALHNIVDIRQWMWT